MEAAGQGQEDYANEQQRAAIKKDSPRLKRALTFDPGHLQANNILQKKLLDDDREEELRPP